MKIMIMTDMEGVAGILNHDDWVMRNGQFYEKGVRLLMGEVNAAIEGFFAGGAQEVTVIDGHGAGGIDPETLDERAALLRGVYKPTWPWGLDESYDALAFVGQHAKAGTPFSHITHTSWFNTIDLSINDVSIGEYGQFALCAKELGIPTILACGEKALCTEAEALTPGVVTASGKEGILDDDGMEELNCDEYRAAKLGAIHKAPAQVRRLIREGAGEAIRRLKRDPQSFSYVAMSPPYTRVCRMRAMGEAPASEKRDSHPESIIALFNQKPETQEADS
ncbi:MAG: M55 family metallopeptidase [Planctomycetota bacterium]|jgi:D-amino peptidase